MDFHFLSCRSVPPFTSHSHALNVRGDCINSSLRVSFAINNRLSLLPSSRMYRDPLGTHFRTGPPRRIRIGPEKSSYRNVAPRPRSRRRCEVLPPADSTCNQQALSQQADAADASGDISMGPERPNSPRKRRRIMPPWPRFCLGRCSDGLWDYLFLWGWQS